MTEPLSFFQTVKILSKNRQIALQIHLEIVPESLFIFVASVFPGNKQKVVKILVENPFEKILKSYFYQTLRRPNDRNVKEKELRVKNILRPSFNNVQKEHSRVTWYYWDIDPLWFKSTSYRPLDQIDHQ